MTPRGQDQKKPPDSDNDTEVFGVVFKDTSAGQISPALSSGAPHLCGLILIYQQKQHVPVW